MMEEYLADKVLVDEKIKERDKGTNLAIKIETIRNNSTSFPKHPYDRPIPTKSNIDGAKPISTPINPTETLLDCQHHCTGAEIARVEDIPYRKSITP